MVMVMVLRVGVAIKIVHGVRPVASIVVRCAVAEGGVHVTRAQLIAKTWPCPPWGASVSWCSLGNYPWSVAKSATLWRPPKPTALSSCRSRSRPRFGSRCELRWWVR